MIRRSTLIAVEVLLGLVAALAIGLGIAWWRLSQGPIELGVFKDQIESELSAARSGRAVAIERVVLGLTPAGNALELRAVGVSVQDGHGGVLSRSDAARIEVAVLPLLIGRVSLVRAEFSGGEITFTRKQDGALNIALGPEGAPPDIVIPPPPPEESLQQAVARMLDGMEAAFRPVGVGGGLRAISVRGAKLAIIDESGGGRWTADAANVELGREGATLALVADARVEGAADQAPVSLRITTDTRFQTAVIEFGCEDARPRALFSPAALGPFAGLDAPLTATISVGLDRRAGVSRFEGEAVLGRGVAEMAGERVQFDGGRVHGRYDVDGDELIFDELALAGDRTRINGEVHVRQASAILRAAPDHPAAFDLALPSVRIDVPGTFAEPVALANVQAVGAIDSASRSIGFTRLRAEVDAGRIEASGRLYWGEAGADHALHPGIELQGTVTGEVDVRTVLRMWPIGLGEGARAYLADTLNAGRVSNIVANLDVRPGDTAADAMRNQAINVRFDVADAAMRFVSTMSPITDARGSGVLQGNRFDLTIPSARFNGMAVSNGRIEAPQFKPRGAMLTIAARIEGEARPILEVLHQEPLNLGDRLPIAVASASGHGVVNVRLQRPMLADVPFEQWRFTIDGAVRDFAGAMTTRHVSLSNGQLAVRGDQRAITVFGPIRAGGSAIDSVRWVERLGRRAGPSSEYQIAGDFDADDLERLGYPVAQYAQGMIGVTVSGAGRGFDVDNAHIDLDLTNAAIEGPRSFWTKRAGQAASARFDVARQRDGGLAFNNIDARGGGLNTQGMVRLTRDERVAEANIVRLVVAGQSDASLTALRAADGGLDVHIRGALFDAAPFMDGSEPTTSNPSAPAVQAPLRADVVVDRLKMRGGATLTDARVALVTQRGALAMLTVEGSSPSGRPFSLGMGPRPAEPTGRILFSSEDAGFAVRALTGSENVVGGTARADGDWRVGPPSSARFNVHMRDFQVVRLPAMARLLSSAGSLTGLVEMLNGDGIGFSAMEAQMTYANDRLAFTEGSMRGPSLGLTGSGAYEIQRDNLDIDGVVAPSPFLNLSLLGEVPVLGNLIVSRRGEGVFGMTYSIDGHAGEPRVGVNPVSALTPGILRRIFEPLPPRPPSNNAHAAPPTPPPAEPETQGSVADAPAAAQESEAVTP